MSIFKLTILLLTCFSSLMLLNTNEIKGDHTLLRPGDELITSRESEGYLISHNKRYKLTNQKDGNLVLYDGANKSKFKELWRAKTDNEGYQLPTRLTLQTDGNLVLYDRRNKVMWASDTSKTVDPLWTRLILQDDGNLVIYQSNDKAVWSTGTYDRK